LHEDTARHGEPVFSREEKSDDIVAHLLPFMHNEMRMPAGLVKTVIEEIERLQADLVNVRDLNEHLTAQLQTFYNEDEAVRGE